MRSGSLRAAGTRRPRARSESCTNKEAQAACTGSALSAAPNLPKQWPDMGEVTFTQQSKQGPTDVVEGYFEGDVTMAHDDFKRELEDSGFKILFDELEAERGDSEVSWDGFGRSGQVALRAECGENDKTYVHVTESPGGTGFRRKNASPNQQCRLSPVLRVLYL